MKIQLMSFRGYSFNTFRININILHYNHTYEELLLHNIQHILQLQHEALISTALVILNQKIAICVPMKSDSRPVSRRLCCWNSN